VLIIWRLTGAVEKQHLGVGGHRSLITGRSSAGTTGPRRSRYLGRPACRRRVQ